MKFDLARADEFFTACEEGNVVRFKKLLKWFEGFAAKNRDDQTIQWVFRFEQDSRTSPNCMQVSAFDLCFTRSSGGRLLEALKEPPLSFTEQEICKYGILASFKDCNTELIEERLLDGCLPEDKVSIERAMVMAYFEGTYDIPRDMLRYVRTSIIKQRILEEADVLMEYGLTMDDSKLTQAAHEFVQKRLELAKLIHNGAIDGNSPLSLISPGLLIKIINTSFHC